MAAQVSEHRLGVLDAMGEGEGAGASPAAPIMEDEHVEAGTAGCLGEILVLLKAGKAVQQQQRCMSACSARLVEHPVKLRPRDSGSSSPASAAAAASQAHRSPADPGAAPAL